MTPRWLLWMAHGPEVFVALVAAFALLGAWAGPIVVRRLREARQRRRRAALGEVRDEVPAGEGFAVVLRGELLAADAGSGVAVVTERYAPLPDGTAVPPRATSAGSLLLKTRNGLVRLPDDVEVVAGTREEAPAGHTAEGASIERRLSVDVGAAVRVEGVIEAARDEAAVRGYRGAAPSWRMVPGGYGRVRVAAEGDGPAGRPGGAGRAVSAAVAAVAGAAAMTAGAQAALLSATARRGEVTVGITRAWCEGSGVTRAALASASPVQRRAALDEVALALRCARRRDATTAAGLDGALRLRGAACVERAAAMASVGALRGASDLGMTCGGPEAAVRAGWIRAGLGEFARASASLGAGAAALRTESELHRAVAVHAMAGAWPAAAAVARRAAELAATRRGERDEDPYARTMWCVADAAAARGGDGEAVRRLEQRLRMDGTPACGVLRAELALVRGEAVAPWLTPREAAPARGYGDPPARDWESARRGGAGADREALRDCLDVTGQCAAPLRQEHDGLALDVALTLRPYEADLLRRYQSMPALDALQAADAARLATSLARSESAAGGHAAALSMLRWANDHADGLDRGERMAVLHAQAWLAAVAGDRDAVEAALGELEGAGEAAPSAMIPLAVRRWHDGDRAGLAGVALHSVADRDAREALTAGRGDLLLAWLRRQQGVVPRAGRRAVLAGLVYRVLDRAEFGAWTRTEDAWLDPASLGRTWRAAAVRLAIATRLGDRETAEAMRAVVSRHRAMASRRDVAMTLSVLGVY